MQIKLFSIPILNTEPYNEDLNIFLRAHKIISIEKHFSSEGNFWCFCITYLEGQSKSGYTSSRKKVDYMEVLDAEAFAAFSKLREIRKQIAIKHAVSAYIVFTDAELAAIAKMEDLTLNGLRKIKGVGKNKAEKYGEELLKQFTSKT